MSQLGTDPNASPVTRPTPVTRLRRRSARWLIVSMLLLVVAPVVFVQVPREIANWHVAAALEHLKHGRRTEALASLERALEWHETNADALRTRAELRINAGDLPGALADSDRALNVAEENVQVIAQRIRLLHLLKRDAEAVEQAKKSFPERSGSALNAQAYARAVGNLELEDGLQQINDLLMSNGGEPAAMLNLANLHRLQGRYADAFGYYHAAIDLAERRLESLKRDLAPNAPTSANDRDRLVSEQHVMKYVLYRASMDRAQLETAHPSLQAAESEQRIRADRERAFSVADPSRYLSDLLQAKFLPTELVRSPLETETNLNMLAAVFDTRGFLHYRQGNLALALADLDLAVHQVDLVRRNWPANHRHLEVDLHELRTQRSQLDRETAVIYYHRSLVLAALGRAKEAEAELAHARKLSQVEPDETLF